MLAPSRSPRGQPLQGTDGSPCRCAESGAGQDHVGPGLQCRLEAYRKTPRPGCRSYDADLAASWRQSLRSDRGGMVRAVVQRLTAIGRSDSAAKASRDATAPGDSRPSRLVIVPSCRPTLL